MNILFIQFTILKFQKCSLRTHERFRLSMTHTATHCEEFEKSLLDNLARHNFYVFFSQGIKVLNIISHIFAFKSNVSSNFIIPPTTELKILKKVFKNVECLIT